MTPTPRDILDFLPSADISRGPFGLLGLRPGACDDLSLVEGLQRALKAVDGHPERSTPRAEAVRAELYRALAQLREHAVRNTLGRRYFPESWVNVEPPAAAPESQLRATATAPSEEEPPMFVRRDPARPTGVGKPFIVASVVLFAGAVGLAVVAAWLGAMRPPPPKPVAPGGTSGAVAPVATAGGVSSPAVTAPAIVTPATQQTPEVSALATISAAEARELLERLRRAAQAEGDPAVVGAEFDSAVGVFESRWVEMPADIVGPAALAVGERLLRTSRASANAGVALYQRLEGPLARVLGADVRDLPKSRGDVVGAVWAAGLLNRLKGDGSVPARLVSSARARLGGLTAAGEVPKEHAFTTGAAMALDAMARRWARPVPETPEEAHRRAWSAWSACAAALDVAGATGASAPVLLNAVGVLLRDGELGLSPLSADALASVLAGVKDWRAAPISGVLLSWFDDPKIEARALSMLTGWMVSQGPMAAVGPSMVLPADATTIQRREMRDAYAVRLGVSASAEAGKAARRWSEAARAALTPGANESASEPMVALATAAATAKLSEAAARLWALDESGAESALNAADANAIAAAAAAPSAARAPIDPTFLTAPGSPPDGEWARRFLAVSGESLRILLLNQLRNGRGPEGPADADVLARAACLATPGTVRQLAQQTLRENADRPEVVNGLLEAIADAPRQKGVAEMVQAVAGTPIVSPSDPEWRTEARRALVERLMQMTADASDQRADALAALLWEACAGSAAALRPSTANRGLGAAGAGTNTPAVSASAESAAADLRSVWTDLARGIPEGTWAKVTFEELERRHAARSLLARTPIHRYLVERLGCAEMAAHTIVGERPSRAAAAAGVLDAMAEARRTAPSVFHQVLAVERAALRLWMIRFGEVLP